MIQTLVRRIEDKLNWGKGKDWSNKDFEHLSEQIFAATKKRLSVTTLKRIWGRAEMVAHPSSATLDILSEFVGYSNWREFTNSCSRPTSQKMSMSDVSAKFIWITVLIVFVGLLLYSSVDWEKPIPNKMAQNSVDPSVFTFEGRVVSSGMPNSVIFNYDATRAGEHAKIEIQQDWDSRKRISVSQRDTVATCIYYRPGFFKSKLVVDGAIVKERDISITTEGWLGVIESDSIPVYLHDAQVNKSHGLEIDLQTLIERGISPNDNPITSLYNVTDFKGLYTNDFELSMVLRNTFDVVPGICQEIEIFVLYDGGAIGMPLAKKGCISNLNLMAFGTFVDGKKNDLSLFGVDFGSDIPVKMISRRGVLKLFVENQLAYEFTETEKRAIKGVSIHFEGTGTVTSLQLNNSKGFGYVYPEDL